MFSYHFYCPTTASTSISSPLTVDTVFTIMRLTRHNGGKAGLALTELVHSSLVSRRYVFDCLVQPALTKIGHLQLVLPDQGLPVW